MDFVHASETSAQKQCIEYKEMRKWKGIWIKSKIEHSISQLKRNGIPKISNNSKPIAFENMIHFNNKH